MKKKDIITLSVSILVIVGVLVFLLRGTLFGKPNTESKKAGTQETVNFSGKIDDAAIEKLKAKKDFMNLPMDGIGRTNPFAGL